MSRTDISAVSSFDTYIVLPSGDRSNASRVLTTVQRSHQLDDREIDDADAIGRTIGWRQLRLVDARTGNRRTRQRHEQIFPVKGGLERVGDEVRGRRGPRRAPSSQGGRAAAARPADRPHRPPGGHDHRDRRPGDPPGGRAGRRFRRRRPPPRRDRGAPGDEIVALLRGAVRLRKRRLPVRLRPCDRALCAAGSSAGSGRSRRCYSRSHAAPWGCSPPSGLDSASRRRLPDRRRRQRDRARCVRGLCLYIREPSRRTRPTDEYDQDPRSGSRPVVLLLPLVEDFAPWQASRRAVPGGACDLWAALGPRGGSMQVHALDDELHEYIVAHGAREDEVLAPCPQAETAAMGDDRADADRARPGRVHDAARAGDRGPRGDRARHLHRLLGDLHRPRPRSGRTARRLRARPSGPRSRATTSPGGRRRPDRDPRRRRARHAGASCPERDPFDLAFIDADKTGYPAYYEQLPGSAAAGGLIVVDNILRGGAMLDPASTKPTTTGRGG